MKPHPQSKAISVQGMPSLASPDKIQQLAAILELMGPSLNAPEPPVTTRPVTAAEWAKHLVTAHTQQLMRRMPLPANKNRPAEQCPYTGMNRNQIYDAMKRRKGRPFIRTISLKEEGEEHAARFYSVQSAIDYMNYLAAEQERDASNEP